MVTIQLDTRELVNETQINVKLYHLKQFRLRLWLAEKIIGLGLRLSWLNYRIVKQHPLEIELERLGEYGIVTSICYGPMRVRGLQWSVTCLHDGTREEFDKPFVASSMAHAVGIAYTEAEKRGWITTANDD